MRLDTSAGGLASLSSVWLLLTTAAIALRFYARYRQKALLRADDWLTIPAWICFVGITAISFYGISEKFMGYRTPTDSSIRNARRPSFQKTYFSLDVVSLLAFGLVKLSALCFYYRVFCNSSKRSLFRYIVIGSIVLVSLWTLTFFIMIFFTCGPNINYVWSTDSRKIAQCKLISTWLLITAVSDVALDIWIIILPLPKIWSLHATTKRKLAISCVFLLAMAGLGASTARMYIFIRLTTAGRVANSIDPYQSNTLIAYYSILEAGSSLVAINLPSLWYFAAKVKPESLLRSVRSMTFRFQRPSQSSLSSEPESSMHKKDGALLSRSIVREFEVTVSSEEGDIEDRSGRVGTGTFVPAGVSSLDPGAGAATN